jgi:hypothetical protein
MKQFKIPKNKIKGQRFGQLLINAIFKTHKIKNDKDVGEYLFNIENQELSDLIDKYLKEQ